MKKNRNELTIVEGKKILKFIYPHELHTFKNFLLDKDQNKVGIICVRDSDKISYKIPFNDTKMVVWFYKSDYDIESLLIDNYYHSEMEKDLDEINYEIQQLSLGDKVFFDKDKNTWNLNYVIEKCKELVSKYYYKEYK